MVSDNGLKKRLISNLVLEAVLDKAMEDYTPSNYNDEPMDSNNEDTSSTSLCCITYGLLLLA